MNFETKNIYASLISTVLIFAIYFAVISNMHADGRFEGPAGLERLGQMVLWLIGGGIVVYIAMVILFNIIFAIAHNDPNPSTLIDERDKLIELRGLRLGYYLAGAGFLVAMLALALGASVFVVIHIMVGAAALSGIAEALLRLCLYHRGF